MAKLKKLWSWSTGKKTYAVGVVTIVWAVVGAVLGALEPQEALNVLLVALGGMGLRHGMK